MTFEFPSRSSSATHTVTVEGTNIKCTCNGYRSPSKCWHVREVAEKLDIPTHARSATSALPWATPREPTNKPISYVDTVNAFFVPPMLGRALKEGESIKDYEKRLGWSLEVKYDGHRVIVHIDAKRIITLFSRDANVINDRIGRHIFNLLSVLPAGTYDGELFIPGKTSTDVTRKDLMHRQQLALFDILKVYAPQDKGRCDALGYRSATDLTLNSRRGLLSLAGSKLAPRSEVFIAPVFPVSETALNAIWNAGGEGVMLKLDSETYQSDRRRWIKFKKEEVGRMTVTGYKAGKMGPHSVVVGVDQHGVVVQCKALDTAMRTAFDRNPDAFIGRVLVFGYQQKTSGQKYRHPRCDHFEEVETDRFK